MLYYKPIAEIELRMKGKRRHDWDRFFEDYDKANAAIVIINYGEHPFKSISSFESCTNTAFTRRNRLISVHQIKGSTTELVLFKI